jgi:type IV secretion system protein VirD4
VTGRDAPTSGAGDGWLYAAAGLVVAGALLWAAGAAATVAAGYRLRTGHPAAGLMALAHPGDPRLAWGGPVGPAWAYWCVSAAVVGLAGAGLFGLWRLFCSSPGCDRVVRLEGLAGRKELRRVAGRRALLARSATLRPGLTRPAPGQVGYRLGSAAGVELWAAVEWSPPRRARTTWRSLRLAGPDVDR